MNATSAMPATAHGRPDAKLVVLAGPSAPAAVPQRWQNLAPGVRGALQAAQLAATSVAPQFEQNLPDAFALQPGQVTTSAAESVVEDAIASKATRRANGALAVVYGMQIVTYLTISGLRSRRAPMTFRLAGTTHFLTIDVADWTADPSVASVVARRNFDPLDGRVGETVNAL